MGLDHYLVGLFAQALPHSFPAIIVAFFLRADRGSAIFFGAVSAMVLPGAAVALGINSRPDVFMAAAIWGALYGWIWSLLKRGTPHVETVTASGPKAEGVTPKREAFSMKYWVVVIPLTVLVHFIAALTFMIVLELNGVTGRPALANGLAIIADFLFLAFVAKAFSGGANSDAAGRRTAAAAAPPKMPSPATTPSKPASKKPAQGLQPKLPSHIALPSGSESAPEPDGYDQAKWKVVKDHDKRVAAALPDIEVLGDEYVELFASKVLAVKPNDRDIGAIAKEVKADLRDKYAISEVEEINAAYQNIANKYGEYATNMFMEVYEIVGDQIDIDKVLERILSEEKSYAWTVEHNGRVYQHNRVQARVDGKSFPSIEAAKAFIDADIDEFRNYL